MLKGVRKGVQLPEDILLEIVKLAPTVEDVLRLERVRRDYQLHLSYFPRLTCYHGRYAQC